MANFPAIKPSSRRFTLGEYPVKNYRSLSGKTTKRIFGNLPFGHAIELGFENVKEDVVNTIIDHYNEQRGNTSAFFLPDEVFAGLNALAISRLKRPAETFWFYAEPPSIESVYRNLSNVTVRLVAEIA